MRSNQNTYKRGTWNAICDICGFKFKADELISTWNGLKVCREDWEPRHPQDYVRAVKESTIPWSRPDRDGPSVAPVYIFFYVDPGYVDVDYFEEL